MKYLISIFLFFSFKAFTQDSQRWMSVYKISQMHPMYRSGEAIQRPSGTFQLLFALHFINQYGVTDKDCVWYKLPNGEQLGEIKVTKSSDKCEDWQGAEVWSIHQVKSLTFILEPNLLKLSYTSQDSLLKSLKFPLMNLTHKKDYALFDSSVEKRGLKGVFVMAPQSLSETVVIKSNPHPHKQECSFETGTCQRCPDGVVKIYDLDSIKYKCGVDRCGEQGEPACWRGVEWKRERQKPSCRQNPWHLYCQQGLRIECEGEQGFCR